MSKVFLALLAVSCLTVGCHYKYAAEFQLGKDKEVDLSCDPSQGLIDVSEKAIVPVPAPSPVVPIETELPPVPGV